MAALEVALLSMTRRKKLLPVMAQMCPTCPFRKQGYTCVRELLTDRALKQGTPVCHSTGPAPLAKRVHKQRHACRGARDLQLQVFAARGFLEAATDAAWEKQARAMGFK